MAGDYSRKTFDPKKHYSAVLMQQGRVQLDADWNEQGEILRNRIEGEAKDLIGCCGGPIGSAGFGLKEGPDMEISKGHYYVDGILCQCDGKSDTEPWTLLSQPDVPRGKAIITTIDSDGCPVDSPATPSQNTKYLIYLDVWRREISWLDDEHIREVALGGPDTATRLKTIWQVKLLQDSSVGCSGDLKALLLDPTGTLKAKTKDPDPTATPCQVPEVGGYIGLENQLYRVEIHQGGSRAEATFKWSRDNGNVVSSVEKIDGKKITISTIGADKNLGFSPGNWVEVFDDASELLVQPGQLAQIDTLDEANRIVTLKSTISSLVPDDSTAFPPSKYANGIVPERHPKLRRWEGAHGEVKCNHQQWIDLESNIQVLFSDGSYRTGDYWLIPARAVTAENQSGTIEAPQDTHLKGKPFGIEHHYAKLGIATFDGNNWKDIKDCRCLFPPLSQVQALYYVSGDGQEVCPTKNIVDTNFVKLRHPLIVGIPHAQCFDPNTPAQVQFSVSSGGGKLAVVQNGTEGSLSADPVMVQIDDGLAKCNWYLNTNQWDTSTATQPYSQQVEARLIDPSTNKPYPHLLPIIFTANLSIASEVAYNPGSCGALSDQHNVQGIIDRLAQIFSLYFAGQVYDPLKDQYTLTVLAANRCGNAKEGLTVTWNVQGQAPISSRTDRKGYSVYHLTSSDFSISPVVIATLQGNDITEPTSVNFFVQRTTTDYDPAPVHIIGLTVGEPGKTLCNDQRVTLIDLTNIGIMCDGLLDERTVCDPSPHNERRGQPTCIITAEIPYPLTRSEKEDLKVWEVPTDILGYRSLILRSEVSVKKDEKISQIVLHPHRESLRLMSTVLSHLRDFKAPQEILLRLTLKGDFIWSTAAEDLFRKRIVGGFLDGEALLAPKPGYRHGLLLPSGDKRRSGDFEMWFWLVPGVEKTDIRVEYGTTNTWKNPLGRGMITMTQGSLENLQQGSTYQLLPNGNVVPNEHGEKGNPCVVSLRGFQAGSTVEVSFVLPTAVYPTSGAGRITCSFDSKSASCDESGEFWNPNAPHILRISDQGTATIKLGITATLPADVAVGTYSGDVIVTVQLPGSPHVVVDGGPIVVNPVGTTTRTVTSTTPRKPPRKKRE